jgi:hypothetical protein
MIRYGANLRGTRACQTTRQCELIDFIRAVPHVAAAQPQAVLGSSTALKSSTET